MQAAPAFRPKIDEVGSLEYTSRNVSRRDMMGSTSSRLFCLAACFTLLTACAPAAQSASPSESGSDSIAGTYECLFDEHPDAQPNVLELREDGTLTFTIETDHNGNPMVDGPPPLEGAWSVEGGSGAVSIEGDDNPFTFEGDRLVFSDSVWRFPSGNASVCTLAS